MPYAILNPDGTIREVVRKLLPSMRIAPGERIVDYGPPAFDAETQTCAPVQPVPAGQAAVSFVVADKPDALAIAKNRALADIDAAAGRTRARYITVVPGQEITYLLKERQARAYQAQAYPFADIAIYPMVQAEAEAINGQAPDAAQCQAAAQGIIAQADAWIALAAHIEQVRRSAKIAALSGTAPAAVTAAALAACRTLDGI